MFCSGKTIEGFDLGVASMKKGEKAILTIQAGYAIKPGHTQMEKMLPNGEKPEAPQILPDVPENMAREDKVIFEVKLSSWEIHLHINQALLNGDLISFEYFINA